MYLAIRNAPHLRTQQASVPELEAKIAQVLAAGSIYNATSARIAERLGEPIGTVQTALDALLARGWVIQTRASEREPWRWSVPPGAEFATV